MRPDYDLSGLATSQADLWLFLQADAIRAEILARPGEAPGIHLVREKRARKSLAALSPSQFLQAALPASPVLLRPYAVSLWVH